ncbi:MAG: 2-amino-4-hydroxy-6-hydroxymethyldihydropteridine diphosphokinase [Mariprofundus sp.]|nr:2-amino-4-hydroxy-6-hydroxymethyldihydropteridine diphosphokinase [Mariprofundus sp.]
MADVLVGMGSNIEPEDNLLRAAAALRAEFDNVRFSSVYRSPAVGMNGDDFLNACCLFDSALDQAEVRQRMKDLEDEQGRDRSRGSWKPRTIDLDMLIYDGEVMDDELYRYAHAFVPASELVEIGKSGACIGQLTPVVLHL